MDDPQDSHSEEMTVSFTSRRHEDRRLEGPRVLSPWEARIVRRLLELAKRPVPANLSVFSECLHCPSCTLTPELGSIRDGYLLPIVNAELKGADTDGMEARFLLRTLEDGGSLAWLEAYRLDGEPFRSLPDVASLGPVSPF